MLIAGILFITGVLFGLNYNFLFLIFASALIVFVVFVQWLAEDHLTYFNILILIGYLAALQSGYLVGSYLGMKGDS